MWSGESASWAVRPWPGWGGGSWTRHAGIGSSRRKRAAWGAGRPLIRTGILTTVSNPYWLLWWATVGGAYFLRFAPFGPAAVLGLFLLGHLSLDLAWNSFLAFAVGTGRGRIPAPVFRGVLGICGVFLVGMSLYFIISGIAFLRR